MYDIIVTAAGIVVWLLVSMNVFAGILTERKAAFHDSGEKRPPPPSKLERLTYFAVAIVISIIILTILGAVLKFLSDIAMVPMKLL